MLSEKVLEHINETTKAICDDADKTLEKVLEYKLEEKVTAADDINDEFKKRALALVKKPAAKSLREKIRNVQTAIPIFNQVGDH